MRVRGRATFITRQAIMGGPDPFLVSLSYHYSSYHLLLVFLSVCVLLGTPTFYHVTLC